MEQKTEPERAWGVICLHCRKPFPVPYGPDAIDNQEGDPTEARENSRTLFLAWCPACNHEAPYSVGELVRLSESQAVRTGISNRVSAFERVAGAS